MATTTVDLADRLLKLPPLQTKFEEITRHAKQPDISTLNEAQLEAFKDITAFLDSNETSMHLLQGYAGTGKTYLTTMILDHILSNSSKMVAVTAPTNKAVKVLKSTSSISDMHLEYMTIHSLLGLREVINHRGEQTFKKQRDEDVKIGEYSVIIVDEASMLADDLFAEMLPYIKLWGLKVLFIGDPAQIPPIGEDTSMPFDTEVQDTHSIGVNMLSEIVRQSADNPIIKTTMAIRNALGRDIILPVRDNEYIEQTLDGVYYLNSEDKDFFFDLLKTYFCSDNFREDADFAKVLAWTNKTVDTLNRLIRKMIYGKGASKLCVGEKLIANRPIINPDMEISKILFTNNDEFEVVSFEVVDGNFYGVSLKYYSATVVSVNDKEKQIKVIHEDSEEDFKLILEHYKSVAIAKKGSYEAIDNWKKFYRAQEVFADVKYNYAITAHKAQGSTYDNVIVMEGDMDKNRKVVERNRIKYTAFTRPSHRLFVIE